jgi:hypothetical protein
VSILEDIYEAMLVAAFIAPLLWLSIVVAGMAIILVRRRIGTLVAIGLIVTLAAVTWFGTIWRDSLCVQCNHVSRIYQMETRWGLLFWEITFLGFLIVLQARAAWRAKRIEKGI